jgi:cellobiose epimerase
VDGSQPQGLIVNSRLLWAFSAVHREHPEPRYRHLAERAFDIVMNRFWDAEHGGAFWRLNHDWAPSDSSKKIYGQAFYIYSLAEYYRAFRLNAALRRATDLFELLERHACDLDGRGYWEVRARDWSEAADSRLSEKDMDEKKSMNNHLHLLEAFTNLFRSWEDPRLERRLRELLEIFEQHILDPGSGHLRHFFDEQWRVKSDTYTYGHDIEASWLLCEAAEVLGDQKLMTRMQNLSLQIARTVSAEALDADGGVCYEGKSGRVLDAGKESWPQAEAAVGFLNAYEVGGDERFLEAASRVWQFIEKKLTDSEHGEWFWRIQCNGQPDSSLPKVSEWKGPYHGTRACLETLRRLRV